MMLLPLIGCVDLGKWLKVLKDPWPILEKGDNNHYYWENEIAIVKWNNTWHVSAHDMYPVF